jgi:hypothetical protein
MAGSPVTLAIECLAFVLVIFAAWLTPGPMRAVAVATA